MTDIEKRILENQRVIMKSFIDMQYNCYQCEEAIKSTNELIESHTQPKNGYLVRRTLVDGYPERVYHTYDCSECSQNLGVNLTLSQAKSVGKCPHCGAIINQTYFKNLINNKWHHINNVTFPKERSI